MSRYHAIRFSFIKKLFQIHEINISSPRTTNSSTTKYDRIKKITNMKIKNVMFSYQGMR